MFRRFSIVMYCLAGLWLLLLPTAFGEESNDVWEEVAKRQAAERNRPDYDKEVRWALFEETLLPDQPAKSERLGVFYGQLHKNEDFCKRAAEGLAKNNAFAELNQLFDMKEKFMPYRYFCTRLSPANP